MVQPWGNAFRGELFEYSLVVVLFRFRVIVPIRLSIWGILRVHWTNAFWGKLFEYLLAVALFGA